MSKLHALLFAALILIVPACGGNISGAAPLFSETFSGAFPGTNWTAPATTGAAPTVAIAGGQLQFSTTAATGTATTTTTASFAIPNVSFSVQLGANETGGLIGTGTIEIIDGTNTVIASMTWDPAGNSITYAILGSPLAGLTVPASDGTLNRFVFSIDAMSKGSWSLNNVVQANNATAITATPLRIRLGATFGTGTSWPVFGFDNVTVTNP